MSIEEVLKLPFEMQLVLAAGYMAYRVAVTGLDRNHRTTDVVFQVLTYGLVAYVTYDLAAKVMPLGVAMVSAVTASIVTASIWRKFGRNFFVGILRASKVTRENFSPSTWDHIIQNDQKWAYISVTRDDDVAFESNLQALPEGLPFEPLDLDTDGNVAIYVTRRISAKEEVTDYKIEDVIDKYGRAHLTYIPASRIKAITISLGTDVISSQGEVEGA